MSVGCLTVTIVRRLTITYIAETAGIPRKRLVHLKTKPLTKAFLENVIESEDDWLQLRIIMSYNMIKADAVPFSILELKRYMSINNYKFIKHQKFIAKVIKELKRASRFQTDKTHSPV